MFHATTSSLRAVIVGGGTGGHIYPALALAQSLKEEFPTLSLLFLGTKRGLEKEIVSQEGLPFLAVTAARWERKSSWKKLGTLFQITRGFREAFLILSRFRPQVVVGTGGYVCVPVVLATALLKIPVVLHEQNAFPGLATRSLARLSKVVCLTFPEAEKYLPPNTKKVLTGLPVRREFFTVDRETGAQRLGVDPRRFFILAVGGSQGARRLNTAFLQVHKEFRGDLRVCLLHVTGKVDYDFVYQELLKMGITPNKEGNIILKPYLHDMPSGLAVADFVVSRAGASFLAELTAKGIPALLVPYPYATDDHQTCNALALARQGAALVLQDQELTGERLCEIIKGLLQDEVRLAEMRRRARECGKPQANKEMVQVISQVAGWS